MILNALKYWLIFKVQAFFKNSLFVNFFKPVATNLTLVNE